MSGRTISIAVVVSALLAGCGTTKTDKHTKVFSYYLNEVQGRDIPSEAFIFLLVNQTKCKGCVVNQHAELKEVLGERDDVMLFTSDPDVYHLLEGIENPSKVFLDEKGLLDKVNLEIFNITIVKTEKGRVKSFRALMIDENDRFKEFL